MRLTVWPTQVYKIAPAVRATSLDPGDRANAAESSLACHRSAMLGLFVVCLLLAVSIALLGCFLNRDKKKAQQVSLPEDEEDDDDGDFKFCVPRRAHDHSGARRRRAQQAQAAQRQATLPSPGHSPQSAPLLPSAVSTFSSALQKRREVISRSMDKVMKKMGSKTKDLHLNFPQKKLPHEIGSTVNHVPTPTPSTVEPISDLILEKWSTVKLRGKSFRKHFMPWASHPHGPGSGGPAPTRSCRGSTQSADSSSISFVDMSMSQFHHQTPLSRSLDDVSSLVCEQLDCASRPGMLFGPGTAAPGRETRCGSISLISPNPLDQPTRGLCRAMSCPELLLHQSEHSICIVTETLRASAMDFRLVVREEDRDNSALCSEYESEDTDHEKASSRLGFKANTSLEQKFKKKKKISIAFTRNLQTVLQKKLADSGLLPKQKESSMDVADTVHQGVGEADQHSTWLDDGSASLSAHKYTSTSSEESGLSCSPVKKTTLLNKAVKAFVPMTLIRGASSAEAQNSPADSRVTPPSSESDRHPGPAASSTPNLFRTFKSRQARKSNSSHDMPSLLSSGRSSFSSHIPDLDISCFLPSSSSDPTRKADISPLPRRRHSASLFLPEADVDSESLQNRPRSAMGYYPECGRASPVSGFSESSSSMYEDDALPLGSPRRFPDDHDVLTSTPAVPGKFKCVSPGLSQRCALLTTDSWAGTGDSGMVGDEVVSDDCLDDLSISSTGNSSRRDRPGSVSHQAKDSCVVTATAMADVPKDVGESSPSGLSETIPGPVSLATGGGSSRHLDGVQSASVSIDTTAPTFAPQSADSGPTSSCPGQGTVSTAMATDCLSSDSGMENGPSWDVGDGKAARAAHSKSTDGVAADQCEVSLCVDEEVDTINPLLIDRHANAATSQHSSRESSPNSHRPLLLSLSEPVRIPSDAPAQQLSSSPHASRNFSLHGYEIAGDAADGAPCRPDSSDIEDEEGEDYDDCNGSDSELFVDDIVKRKRSSSRDCSLSESADACSITLSLDNDSLHDQEECTEDKKKKKKAKPLKKLSNVKKKVKLALVTTGNNIIEGMEAGGGRLVGKISPRMSPMVLRKSESRNNSVSSDPPGAAASSPPRPVVVATTPSDSSDTGSSGRSPLRLSKLGKIFDNKDKKAASLSSP